MVLTVAHDTEKETELKRFAYVHACEQSAVVWRGKSRGDAKEVGPVLWVNKDDC